MKVARDAAIQRITKIFSCCIKNQFHIINLKKY